MPDLTLESLAARVAALEARQPVEPLYTLREAAYLIPCGASTLLHRLRVLKAALSPARYRWDPLHRRHRLLPAADVLAIRHTIVKPRRHG